MAEIVLADNSAIVAALSRRDEFHHWAGKHFARLKRPCLTCEAVISKCFFLLDPEPKAVESLLSLLERGLLVLGFDAAKQVNDLVRPMRTYADTPMSFADACLVQMAELHRGSIVFTTDSDFQIYRKHRRQAIPVIAPW